MYRAMDMHRTPPLPGQQYRPIPACKLDHKGTRRHVCSVPWLVTHLSRSPLSSDSCSCPSHPHPQPLLLLTLPTCELDPERAERHGSSMSCLTEHRWTHTAPHPSPANIIFPPLPVSLTLNALKGMAAVCPALTEHRWTHTAPHPSPANIIFPPLPVSLTLNALKGVAAVCLG